LCILKIRNDLNLPKVKIYFQNNALKNFQPENFAIGAAKKLFESFPRAQIGRKNIS